MRLLGQLPGPLEAYVTMHDWLNQPPAVSSAWRHLSKWLSDLDQFKPARNDRPRQRILIYSVLPPIVDYSLALSIVLMARGAVIDFAWSSYPTNYFETPPTIGYPYWLRSMRRIVPRISHPYLKLIDLDTVEPCLATDAMCEIAALQARKDARYVLLRERTHIDTDPADRRAYEFRVARNLEAVTKVARLLDTNRYDRVFVLNGAILEFGAVFGYVARQGLPTVTLEIGPGNVMVASGPTVMNMDTSDMWKRDEPHILSDERRMRVHSLIERRRRPATRNVTLNEYQLVGVTPAEQTRTQLGLRSDLPVVLICPNVPFDAAYFVEGKRCFLSLWEWLTKTVRYLAGRNDCQVVVRSHPAEPYYRTSETTASLIREFLPDLPAHVQIIPPEAPVSTYAIMEIADLGVVHYSTTGLEMAMLGLPVVCGVPAVYYNNKGFTLDPATPEEYFAYIDRVVRNPHAHRLTPRQVELAWCYADVFFHQWWRPFPWRAGAELWRDLKAWPMARMWSPEGEEKYGGVFRALLGESA
jgi:hypothetical protein